ncbi:hypothetical protein HMPREF0262_00238 [Clostridium sp. ATCC 29733]|nr:hypothetical protein HMPREF0262_00238 [Clostridium sp. ATCC 29733]
MYKFFLSIKNGWILAPPGQASLLNREQRPHRPAGAQKLCSVGQSV